jgi:hypothetical protein
MLKVRQPEFIQGRVVNRAKAVRELRHEEWKGNRNEIVI